MKTTILTRISAMAMSAVFALVATAGVAFMMTQNGEHSVTRMRLTQISAAAAAAQKSAPADAAELSQWKSTSGTVKQVI